MVIYKNELFNCKGLKTRIRSKIKSVPEAYYGLLYAIFYGTPWSREHMEYCAGSSGGLNGIALDLETGKFSVFEVQKNGKIKIYK